MNQAIEFTKPNQSKDLIVPIIAIKNEIAEYCKDAYSEDMVQNQQYEINSLKREIHQLSLSLKEERAKANGFEIDLMHAIEQLGN